MRKTTEPSNRRPLPAGTVIQYDDIQAEIVEDNGGAKITVSHKYSIEEWDWVYDGLACFVVKAPPTHISEKLENFQIFAERVGNTPYREDIRLNRSEIEAVLAAAETLRQHRAARSKGGRTMTPARRAANKANANKPRTRRTK